MKKAPLMIAVWAVAVVPAFSLPIPDPHTQRTVAFEGKHKKVILEVTGIRWTSCPKRVQSALVAVEGVSSADVGPTKDSKVSVTVFMDKKVKVSDLIAALKAAGYDSKEKATPWFRREDLLPLREAQWIGRKLARERAAGGCWGPGPDRTGNLFDCRVSLIEDTRRLVQRRSWIDS